ncbi:hypothetical protein Q31b_04300 [Novipirellula aureliae]|uniref:Uncharacterized protein n=1 Tax=Novipirellula aureliae TaxID=2527966 RepID=A0A5C6EDF3_9BACT|nr:TMEM43 family protein [Novipirellula aureliae]TWU45259.1 hypothetical protein Q31b_04300 [Novipirellula aureliae]
MVTEVTHESWFSRLGSSLKGILIGGVLFLVSFPLLFWNEGRAVHTAQGLTEGAGAVVKVNAEAADPANESKFVYTSGTTTTSDVLTDDTFNISYPGIRLERHAEMYQWEQDEKRKEKKKLGGGTTTTTTYSYDKVWSDDLINSDDFKESGHHNPNEMPFPSRQQQATHVMLGGFRLPESLIDQISQDEPLPFEMEQLPAEIAQKSVIRHDGPNRSPRLYWSPKQKDAATEEVKAEVESVKEDGSEFAVKDIEADSDADAEETTSTEETSGSKSGPAQIGDVRVWFTATPVGEVSVMSKQFGETFEPYQTKAGTQLSMLAMGIVSPEAMIAQAEAANARMTWILRGVGTLLMFAGLAFFLKPLAVLGDVVPFFGSIVEFGTTMVAALIAISLSLLTISIAWIVYRPLLGVGLLIAAVAVFVFVIKKTHRNKAAPSG